MSDDSSLIEKLRKAEALLAASEAEKETLVAQLAEFEAEKNRLLSRAPAPVPISSLASITEAESEEGGNEEEPIHGMVEFEFGSFSSYNANLKLQKSSKARRNNSVLSSISHGTNATVRSAEEMQGIRNIHRRSAGSEWDNVNLSLDANELDNENVTDQKHHGSTPFYLPPIQRQRWCEDQILPHVNWGDLFFDLFYVGAAFNL